MTQQFERFGALMMLSGEGQNRVDHSARTALPLRYEKCIERFPGVVSLVQHVNTSQVFDYLRFQLTCFRLIQAETSIPEPSPRCALFSYIEPLDRPGGASENRDHVLPINLNGILGQ